MTRFSLKVIPKSGRSELKLEQNLIKVWLKSAPEDGKANDELVRTLADKLKLSRGSIKIVLGKSSRNKLVDITGISMEEIKKTLG